MGKQAPAEQFAKFCEYILGRRPEEFGLVLDEDGFVKIKEFLKAVSETPGWKHIRRSNINEMFLVCRQAPVEIADEMIRAKDRQHLPQRVFCEAPPGLLYTCVRQKAYPVVLEKGISPTHQQEVICAENPEMADLIGRRRDKKPVRLTIHSKKAAEKGVMFYKTGEGLYAADYIPPEAFTGPPPPKELEKQAKNQKQAKQDSPPRHGTFIMEPEKQKAKPSKSKPKWKKDKRARKSGKHKWPDEY